MKQHLFKWGIILGGIIGFLLLIINDNPFVLFGYFGLYLWCTIAQIKYFYRKIEQTSKYRIISTEPIKKIMD